jgi:hypothetical protein
MPIFKSTYNILKKPDEDEVFNPNWMDSDKLVLPPTKPWDYQREMTIEDVDIWEVLVENGGGFGIYASWCPYAEFYLITTGSDERNVWSNGNNTYNDKHWEVYYGAGAQELVKKRAKDFNLHLPTFKLWVEDQNMWLHQKENNPKTLIII